MKLGSEGYRVGDYRKSNMFAMSLICHFFIFQKVFEKFD